MTPEEQREEFMARSHAEASKDGVDLVGHGPGGSAAAARDLGIGEAGKDQVEDVTFRGTQNVGCTVAKPGPFQQGEGLLAEFKDLDSQPRWGSERGVRRPGGHSASPFFSG